MTLVSFCLTSCNKKTNADPHNPQESKHQAYTKDESEKLNTQNEHDDLIIFHDEDAEKYGVVRKKIEPSAFNQIIPTFGEIEFTPEKEKVVVATSGGIVQYNISTLNEGTQIKSGQSLMSISSKKLPDGDNGERAIITYQIAEQEYERATSLYKEQLISQKEFNEAKLTFENAKIAYNAISGNTGKGGVSINAPMNGFIKSKFVKNGDYVSVGDPLFVISDQNRLQLKAFVPLKYNKQLPSISSANLELPYEDKVLELADYDAKVTSYARSINNQEQYIPIFISFNNNQHVVAGTASKVYLIGDKKENVLSLPKSALLEEGGLLFVYVEVHNEEYEKRYVTTGMENGIDIEIVDGLNPSDVVVVERPFLIRLSQMSGEISDGHTH